MNRDLRVFAIILSPHSPRFERLFLRPKIGYEGHFWFFARNVGNNVQNIADIVWIVIYAFSRSFWAQTRLDWKDFFDGPKLAPWRAILVFWPKALEIMYKSCKYFMNRDPRVAAIILSTKSTRFKRIFWRPKIGSLEGHFRFLAQNAGNHVQNIANIVWIVICAYSRSFWAQTRLDLRDFFDGPNFAPWRAILGFWPETLEIMYKTLLILYEQWSTRSRDHFEPKLASI